MIFSESDSHYQEIDSLQAPSVQTEMPHSNMLSDADLIQAFIPPAASQRKDNTDALLLK